MRPPMTVLALAAASLLVLAAAACSGDSDAPAVSPDAPSPEPSPSGTAPTASPTSHASPGAEGSSSEGKSLSPHPRAVEEDAGVVFDGDSLTVGYLLPTAESYPTQLMAQLPPSIEWVNVAVSGQIWPQLLADAEADVDTRFRTDRAANVVVAWAAANDLASGFSAAEIYENARTYCQGRRRRGFRVVVITMYPLQPMDVDPEYDETRRAYNDLLRAGWKDFADGLVDVAADERIGDASGPERSVYFLDLVHLTGPGYGVIADCVRPVLERVLSR